MRLAPPLNCFRDLWQHETLRLGTVAFTLSWSNMDYQCEVSDSLPPALHYLWWQIAFSGGAYGARTQHHTIRILCLRQVTLHWNAPPGMVMLSTTGVTSTPSGMVMLLIPRVTLTPLSDGKDTLEKCYSTLRQVGMHGSLCIANLSNRTILLFLARFGFGFHLCLHILGCFATC